MTTSILESIARPKPTHSSKAVLSAHIVPFRPQPDPIIYRDTVAAEEWQKPWKHVQDSYPVTDPLEYFFYSVISGAAIVSVLIGILSLPSSAPVKTELSRTGALRAAENSLVTQN
jgi:hypothetical protein